MAHMIVFFFGGGFRFRLWVRGTMRQALLPTRRAFCCVGCWKARELYETPQNRQQMPAS